MINWITNNDGYEGEIQVGDMVHLKVTEGFDHRVQGIVTSISENRVRAIIKAVFDWNSGAQVTSGLDTLLRLIEDKTEIEFSDLHVHKLIKANT